MHNMVVIFVNISKKPLSVRNRELISLLGDENAVNLTNSDYVVIRKIRLIQLKGKRQY